MSDNYRTAKFTSKSDRDAEYQRLKLEGTPGLVKFSSAETDRVVAGEDVIVTNKSVWFVAYTIR